MKDPKTGIQICSTCRIEPALSYARYCRGCHNERQKRYHKNHPESIRASFQRRRNHLRDIAREGKEQPCADCGQSYPFYVMDYDHVRGEKLMNISIAPNKVISESKLIEEIAKCDVVCSNCHRERTWSRGQGYCKKPVCESI
jgi:hypothetical protein